jgi:hypothetical protein
MLAALARILALLAGTLATALLLPGLLLAAALVLLTALAALAALTALLTALLVVLVLARLLAVLRILRVLVHDHTPVSPAGLRMDEAMPRLAEAIEFGPSKIPVGKYITVRTGVAFPTIARPRPIKAGINFGQNRL